MLGKPRPNSDRSSSEPARPAASGALTGISTNPPKTPRRPGLFGRPTDTKTSTLRSAAADAQRSRLPQMAAALAYRTIFGLLPVLIVALVAVKYFASEEHVRTVVERALSYTGLSSIAVSEGAAAGGGWLDDMMGPPPPPTVAPAPEAVADAATEGAPPPPPPGIDKWITGLIERVNTVSFKAIGFIGVVTLIYAAIAMLVEIERAFNQIYRVPRGRSWIRRIMQYWTLLTLGPLALLSTFYVGQQFAGRVEKMASDHGYSLGSGALTISATGYAVTVLISTGFFLLAYICVPNTKVKFRPALVGALASALLWEAGKWGFTQYLAYSTFNAQIYGALALIPLFLLWVYFTWLIVLFGLQIAYQLQHGRANTRAQPFLDIGPTLVDPAAALVVLSGIARGFDSGRAEDAAALTKATRLPEPVVRLVLAKLSERGLLHRLENEREDAEPTFVLARSPSSIRVAEILELGYELAGSAEPDEAVDRLHRVQVEAVGDQTLASLVAQGGQPRFVGGAATGGVGRGTATPPSQEGSPAATLA
ncbi:MAG: YihY family inner membrane protein [Phycisphaeraceae bacterium]|nr:YihY family inner membrane protein [Phycisphaeraceae bacterium]